MEIYFHPSGRSRRGSLGANGPIFPFLCLQNAHGFIGRSCVYGYGPCSFNGPRCRITLKDAPRSIDKGLDKTLLENCRFEMGKEWELVAF